MFIGAGYLNQELRINLLKVLDSNGTQVAKIFFADYELNFLHDFTHCPCGISFLTFYFCYCSDLIKRENILERFLSVVKFGVKLMMGFIGIIYRICSY